MNIETELIERIKIRYVGTDGLALALDYLNNNHYGNIEYYYDGTGEFIIGERSIEKDILGLLVVV